VQEYPVVAVAHVLPENNLIKTPELADEILARGTA